MVLSEDIPRLSAEWSKNIRTAIEEKLTTYPQIFGKPLRISLKNYRKLRVGDYRVVFRIDKTIVKIFSIGHRSVVYQNVKKRL